jgi:type 1 glutamine amidotransferase
LPETIHVLDEAYWPLKGDRSKITVLATSEETISKDSEQTKPEPMFYTYEHGKGRVFSCILGHYTWTFDDPYVRILLLRGMAWAAGESPYRFDRLVLRGIE